MLMLGNDVLRRVRYALDLRNLTVVKVFAHGGVTISEPEVQALFLKDHEDGYVECTTDQITAFLDGLIVELRGPRESKPGQAAPPAVVAETNNVILKKLRIALDLKDADMQELLELGGFRMSKPELSALFRKPGHKHYRECGDQVLRYFLVGVTRKRRPESAEALTPTV